MRRRNVFTASPATPVKMAKTQHLTPLDKARAVLESDQPDLIRSLLFHIDCTYELREFRAGREVVA